MSFNIDKCVVMHLGHRNLQLKYYMNGSEMKITECEKDIGVHMHQSLKPSSHIAEAVKKANRALCILVKCLTYRDKYHYIRLYKTYVRCHLEYAVQAWNPWSKEDIENLEAVQKRAIRYCHGLVGTSYEEKLKEVGLTSLVERRRRGDMLQTYKILNKIDDVDYHTWFSKIDEHHQKTRQAVSILPDGNIAATDNLVKPKFKLDIRKNFFSCRVVDPWNNLPEEVRRSEDVVAFKKNYDAWLEVRS